MACLFFLADSLNNRLQDDDLFDERILGGGFFVEQVLSAAEIDIEEKPTLDKLISRVAAHCDIAGNIEIVDLLRTSLDKDGA